MTITRVRTTPGGHDQYGDPIPAVTTRTVLDRCTVAPRSSSELAGRGRQGVIVGLSLYGPPGTDLVYTDQVDVDGTVYAIEGEPGRWNNPFTRSREGIEAALNRAVG